MGNVTDELIIVRLSEVDENVRKQAIEVFVDSFYEVYQCLSKDRNKLVDFFLETFNMSLSFAAFYENTVAGFMAICNGKERSLQFRKTACKQVAGKVKGSIGYYQLRSIIGKPNLIKETDIGIDYLATRKQYRGKGIATGLLEYACKKLCYEECFIDVSTNNPVAMNLYEHVGFKQYDVEKGIAVRMLGFGTISRMKKSVNMID